MGEKKKKAKSLAVLIVLVVAVIGVLAAMRLLKPSEEDEETMVPVVRTEKLTERTIEIERQLTGTVSPAEVAYVYPKAAGEITGVFVSAGDVVEEGDPVCTIDTKQVEAARLSMEAAQSALTNANDTLARQRALYEAGDVAKATFEGVELQAKSAQIQFDQAKLAYEYQLEFANVTAPISGIIEKCDIKLHDNVASSVLLCVVSAQGGKEITFSVPENIAAQLSVGDDVEIEKDSTTRSGNITEVSSMADSATGLFSVKATVLGADALATGTTVNVRVVADRAENAKTLPAEAIYYAGGNAYVYLCEEGTVHRVAVEVGLYDASFAQILSGVSDTDEVITSWSSELFEGSAVEKAE